MVVTERFELKLLDDDGMRATPAPDWPTGLKALARVVRALHAKHNIKLDSETESRCALWETRPDDVRKPFVFFACGGFAVQFRVIKEGAP